jgi:hypothetical protein
MKTGWRITLRRQCSRMSTRYGRASLIQRSGGQGNAPVHSGLRQGRTIRPRRETLKRSLLISTAIHWSGDGMTKKMCRPIGPAEFNLQGTRNNNSMHKIRLHLPRSHLSTTKTYTSTPCVRFYSTKIINRCNRFNYTPPSLFPHSSPATPSHLQT